MELGSGDGKFSSNEMGVGVGARQMQREQKWKWNVNWTEFTFVARSFDRLCDTKRGGSGDSNKGIIIERDGEAGVDCDDGGGGGGTLGDLTWQNEKKTMYRWIIRCRIHITKPFLDYSTEMNGKLEEV